MSPRATAFLRYIDKTPPALNRLLDTSLALNVFTDWVNFCNKSKEDNQSFSRIFSLLARSWPWHNG